jgi:hypothetical protein
MGAPKYARFVVDFDEWFPQGLYLVGEITAVTEYQSQEDKARNRPVRPRVDEATGHPPFRGNFTDPAAEKDREKSVTVEFACAHPAGPTGRRAGAAVSAGGPGRHDGDTARGSIRSGQVDHLDHPSHRHDSAR